MNLESKKETLFVISNVRQKNITYNVRNKCKSILSQFRLGKIPKKIQPTYMECVAKNPSKRPDPAEKVKVLRAGGQYLKNDLIDTMIFLEEFQVILR